MNIKIISFFLLSLFLTITIVSASDEIIDINQEKINEDNNIVNFNGDSFTDLNLAINDAKAGDTIKLENNISLKNEEKDSYLNGILINKDNLTIDGNGHEINGNDSVRIFQITSNNIILKNLILTNGRSVSGGAIHNTGHNTLLINNTIKSNTATTGSGGAIFNTGHNFQIIGENLFNQNLALQGGGAVIFNRGENFLIDGENIFEYNSASLRVGGVIFNYGNNFKINGKNTFQYNTADAFTAGVLYNSAENFLINGTNLFQYNTAGYYGGVLYNNFSSNFTISGENIFENNLAIDGGAIYNTEGSNFTIIGANKIQNNFALDSGGGLFNLKGENLSIIGNNIIINNTASNNGGGILTSESKNFLIVGDNLIGFNEAINNGGGIFASGTNYIINGNEFINNTQSSIYIHQNSEILIRNSNLEGSDYLIYNRKSNLSLENNSISSKEAKIFNNGIITSDIYLLFLNNETIYIKDNNTINLTSQIIDDNGNIIVGESISFNINNNKILTTDNSFNGIYYIEESFNDYGYYLISGSYNGAINTSVLTGIVHKFQYESKINLTIINASYGENILVLISLKGENNELLDGTVYLSLNNNQTFNTSIINGLGNYTIDYLSGGNYTLTATFKGNELYGISENYRYFTVNRENINLTTNDMEFYYLNGIFYAILNDSNNNPLINYTVYFSINNRTYNKITNALGIASISINLNPGNYTISTLFNGTLNYSKQLKTNQVIIKPTIKGEDIIKYYLNDTQFYLSAYDKDGNYLINKDIEMNINGVFYKRITNSSGIAKLAINLNPGNYTITIIHPEDKLSMSNIIQVLSPLNGADLIKYFHNDSQYQVEVLDNNGKPLINTDITMNINGVFYTRKTNDEGIATLTINLNPENYIITVEHPISKFKHSNFIKVLPILTGGDVDMTTTDRKSYELRLVDYIGNPLSGKNISININGIFYNRETNYDGIASLNINLDPGIYIATANYDGYQTSNKITINP